MTKQSLHPEKLQSVKTIVCHANCPDGLASAMILHNVLPDAEIVFLQYNTPELTAFPATEGQLWCDFCPPADRFREFIAAGTIVLDHHKSARAVVEAFGDNGIFADEKTEPGVSGAMLAYRHVWKPLFLSSWPYYENSPVRGHLDVILARFECFATLAGIRDTWQRQSPDWEEACAQAESLLFWPNHMWLNTSWNHWDEMLGVGPTLIAKHAEKVDKAIKGGFRFTSHGGKRVIMFQGVATTSDAAEKLGDEVDLVVGFRYENDAEGLKIVFSLRSHTGFDCSKMAKEHPGGGGHTGAAGFAHRFTVTAQNQGYHDPYYLFLIMLDVHEQGRAWGQRTETPAGET